MNTAPPTLPILDEQERESNARRKSELFRVVAEERPLLFVGAGCSALSGYPTWSRLGDLLENTAVGCGVKITSEHRRHKDDPIFYCSLLKEEIKSLTGSYDRCHSLVHETFKKKSENAIDGFHRDLVKTPFAGIVTT